MWPCVMAGLVPAIHVLKCRRKNVDHRDKPGDDAVGGGAVSATMSSLRVFAGTVTAFPHKRERRREPRPIKSSGEGNVAAPLHVSIGALGPLTARKRHRVVRHASQGRHRAGQGTVNIACLASLGALR